MSRISLYSAKRVLSMDNIQDIKAFNSYVGDSTLPKDDPRQPRQQLPSEPLESSEPEVQSKRNLVFEEQARALAKQDKFFEAIACLENVEMDGADDDCFGLDLLKAECYIQLGRETKAVRAIREVKKALLSGPPIDPDLLISLGESIGSEESFLRSIILFRIASDLYKGNSRYSPNEMVDGISRCIQVSKDVLAEVSKDKQDTEGLLKKAMKSTDSSRLKVIILDFGIEYMKEMLEDLRAIEGANQERKTVKEAWSATHIGFVLGNVHEFEKSYKIRKQGVEAMERDFGDRAGFHHVYAVLLHNMGIVLHNSQRYAEAKEIYEKSLIAKEMALDHGGQDKQKDIEDTRKALEVTRRHMLLA